jgi:hypothetical protein
LLEKKTIKEVIMFRLLALLMAFTALAVSPAGAADGPHKTQTLRFFDEPTSTTVTTADGKVIDKPPYPDPKAGDVLDVYSLDFVGNHRHHAKHWSASAHLRCVFGDGPPDCVSHTAMGGSLLIFGGNPGTLIAGTGRYAGATGRVLSNHEVEGGSDIVAKIRLKAPDRTAAREESRYVAKMAALTPQQIAGAFGTSWAG